MRTREEAREVLHLAEERLRARAIARITGIPQTTVQRWIAGSPPRFDDLDAATCWVPARGTRRH
jgi:transposase-like protein